MAKTKAKRIFHYVRDIAVDSVKRRLYLITAEAEEIVSVDYDGTGQKVIFHKATSGFRILNILGNSLYCSNIFSQYVVELDVSSGKIDRFIPFVNGRHPSEGIVVSSLEMNGKF